MTVMIDGDVYVTPHAVRQFRARIAPWMSFEDARSAIIAELREHAGAPHRLGSGRGVYVRCRGGRWAFRAVICRGLYGPAPAVVTVLRSGR